MIRDILEKENMTIDIRRLDLYGREPAPLKRNIGFWLGKIAKKMVSLLSPINGDEEEVKIQNKVHMKCCQLIDSDTKAIIFVGGGLVKYEHQFLSKPLIQIIQFAEKINVPVMLSAVGVEGYDSRCVDCMELKRTLNSHCIKRITTRDDLELLDSDWIENAAIKTARVADPACSISAVYPRHHPVQKKTIGLGIGRQKLFCDYGVQLNDDYIADFWCDLYRRLTDSGFRCVFFTNGLRDDHAFAVKIVNKLQLNLREALLRRPTTVKELAYDISGLDGAIVTRLHAAIISFSYAVPCISLVWNNKQRMFGNIIDRPECFVNPSDLNADYVFDAFIRAYKKNKANNYNRYLNSTKYHLNEFLREYVL